MNPTLLSDAARQANADWAARHLDRKPATISSLRGSRATVDGQPMIMFASSDYLGLGQDMRVREAAVTTTEAFGVGSTGSRLTTGTTSLHTAAEASVANVVGAEDACFFATGYQANLSTIQALAQLCPDVEVFSDARNHASIIDGCRIARCPVHVYPHRDMTALDQALRKSRAQAKLIVSDGLFSMHGTLADVRLLTRLAKKYGAWLAIDDAHAFGTVGPVGRGTCAHFDCALPDVLVVTASKALGSEGAFVCASQEFVAYLRNRARSFVFSTAAPPASAAAITAALELVPEQLATLRSNLCYFHTRTDQSFLRDTADSPIIAVPVGSEDAALSASAQLRARNLWVPAIRYPTVEQGAALLRITITAHHSTTDLDELIAALADLRRTT